MTFNPTLRSPSRSSRTVTASDSPLSELSCLSSMNALISFFQKHGEFKDFVKEAGRGLVEFFDLGGDPRELMAYMVRLAPFLVSLPGIMLTPLLPLRSRVRPETSSPAEAPSPDLGRCADPGILPGWSSLTGGDVGKKQEMIGDILEGCYKATYMPDHETGRAFACHGPSSVEPLSSALAVDSLHDPSQPSFPIRRRSPIYIWPKH